MKVKKQLQIPAISIPLWWPDLPGDWRAWLPSRGNVLFTLVMIAVLLWAQSAGAVPFRAESAASTGTIAYQGRLADSSGNPLTQTLNMSFRLYAGATGGVPLWTEQWTGSNGVQVSDGLFNVMLGSLTPIPQSVITGNSTLFLGITVGTDDEMSPRVQLGSVPFAVQALTVPDGSITKAKLAPGVSFTPTTGSITTTMIADSAVTSTKLSRTLIAVEMSNSMSLPNRDTWYNILSTKITLPREMQVTIYATVGLQNGSETLMAADITIDGSEIIQGQNWTRGGIGETIPLVTSLLLGPGNHEVILRGYSWTDGTTVNTDKRTRLVVILG